MLKNKADFHIAHVLRDAAAFNPIRWGNGAVNADALPEAVARLRGLGVGWRQVSAVNVYTVHDIFPFLRDHILAALGDAGRHGLRWHFARPPISGLEFEMDVRGVCTEFHLPAE